MEVNNTKLPTRGRKPGEWEGDGLSRIGGKEESGADAESIWLLGRNAELKIRRRGGRMKEGWEKKSENVEKTGDAVWFECGALMGAGFVKRETGGNGGGAGGGLRGVRGRI